MGGGNVVKLAVLRNGARPHLIVARRAVVRLIPDFPVLNIQMEAIRPAFIKVANDMFANDSPLMKVLGRNCSMFFDLMLNRLAQPEERFGSGIQADQNGFIGARKIIRSRITGISVKIGENARDIVAERTSVSTYNPRVMVA